MTEELLEQILQDYRLSLPMFKIEGHIDSKNITIKVSLGDRQMVREFCLIQLGMQSVPRQRDKIWIRIADMCATLEALNYANN